MKREDVKKYIGREVTINGFGDLGMDSLYRTFIKDKTVFEIGKLTKGGMVVLNHFNKVNSIKTWIHTLTISPKNLDLVIKK